MELKGFNKNKWVTIQGIKFKVDYPTQEQKYKLDSIMQDATILDEEGHPKSYNIAEWNKFSRFYIKYTVKDWQGITAEGKAVKCKLVDNELEDSLWESLVASDEFTGLLNDEIGKALKWDATDKKK